MVLNRLRVEGREAGTTLSSSALDIMVTLGTLEIIQVVLAAVGSRWSSRAPGESFTKPCGKELCISVLGQTWWSRKVQLSLLEVITLLLAQNYTNSGVQGPGIS